MTARQLHHSAICVRDMDTSLRFYREGLGMVVLMDQTFEGDWPTLFGATTDRLRSVMLGDPDAGDAGVVELVDFVEPTMRGPEHWVTPPVEPDGPPPSGFFLLSLFVDLDATLARLEALGLALDVRRIAQPTPDGSTVPMATLADPDGVLVELIGAPPPTRPEAPPA